MCVCVCITDHVAVHLKVVQHCKLTALQLEKAIKVVLLWPSRFKDQAWSLQGLGHCNGGNSIPGLGTSTCCRLGQKEKNWKIPLSNPGPLSSVKPSDLRLALGIHNRGK